MSNLINTFQYFRGSSSHSTTDWAGAVFPMIRVFAQAIALDLVRVQPMDGVPSGMLFYMDYQYNKNLINRFKYFKGIL